MSGWKIKARVWLGSRDGTLLWADIYNQRLTSVIIPWGALSVVITVQMKHIYIINAVDSMAVFLTFFLYFSWESVLPWDETREAGTPRLIIGQRTERDTFPCHMSDYSDSENPSRCYGADSRLLACWYVCEMWENYSEQPQARPLIFTKYQEVAVISHRPHQQMRCEWEK